MPGVRGKPKDYYDKARFIVEIDGFVYAGFQKCSDIGFAMESISHWEGGDPEAHKKPALKVTYEPVTLERGFSDNNEMYEWATAIREGRLTRDERIKNARLICKDEAGEPKIIFHLFNCWPKELKVGSWDSTAAENLIESTVLEFESYKKEIL